MQIHHVLMQGDQPLKEVFAVEDNVELQSLPFSKPLGAVMAGHT